MENVSKFGLIDGEPDLEQIEEWAEEYYSGLLNMMKPLLARAEINDMLNSLAAIPFEKLVTEALAGESPAVIKLAVDQTKQIAAREISYIQAYM